MMKMNFKSTGMEVILYQIQLRGEAFIINEIERLKDDLKNTKSGKYQLKEIDGQWNQLSRGDKINKGKRFKTYLQGNVITGVSIVKDKENHPIEYLVH